MNADKKRIVAGMKTLVNSERRIQCSFLRGLNKVEDLRIHVELGYSSVFSYMTKELHLSESSAAKRLRAARAAKKFPAVYKYLEDGRTHVLTLILCWGQCLMTSLQGTMQSKRNCEIKQRLRLRRHRDIFPPT